MSWVTTSASNTLSCHFCKHKLPSGNCVSDLSFKIREVLVSLKLSASRSFVCFLLVCYCVCSWEINLGSAGKNRANREIIHQLYFLFWPWLLAAGKKATTVHCYQLLIASLLGCQDVKTQEQTNWLTIQAHVKPFTGLPLYITTQSICFSKQAEV